jgi:hypothetical protein
MGAPQRKGRLFLRVAGASAAAAILALAARPAPPPATAGPAPSLSSVELAVVATPHDPTATRSEVRVATIGAELRWRTIGAIPHAPGAVLRGDVLRREPGAFAVVADEENARDPEYGSVLFRVDASGTKQLAAGLAHASQPLGSVDGAIYVERGVRGALPSEEEARGGALRVDTITISAVDATTGAVRAVYTDRAYALHLAGEHAGELIVYRVDPRGASLLGIDRVTGHARHIADLPPFARDFSVDARAGGVVLSNRDASDSALWVVERVDLATGARTRLHAERDESPAPMALPTGEVLWTAAARGGLARGGTRVATLGPGFDAARVSTDDGAWIALVHIPAAGFDAAAALHLDTQRTVRLSTGAERIEPIGFSGATAGSVR